MSFIDATSYADFLFHIKLKYYAAQEKKLTKQIKEQQEIDMKACHTKQKTVYKTNKTRLKKVMILTRLDYSGVVKA